MHWRSIAASHSDQRVVRPLCFNAPSPTTSAHLCNTRRRCVRLAALADSRSGSIATCTACRLSGCCGQQAQLTKRHGQPGCRSLVDDDGRSAFSCGHSRMDGRVSQDRIGQRQLVGSCHFVQRTTKFAAGGKKVSTVRRRSRHALRSSRHRHEHVRTSLPIPQARRHLCRLPHSGVQGAESPPSRASRRLPQPSQLTGVTCVQDAHDVMTREARALCRRPKSRMLCTEKKKRARYAVDPEMGQPPSG